MTRKTHQEASRGKDGTLERGENARTLRGVEPNFKNRTLWTGDNLYIMRGLNSETIDLIYLDPPFNSNFKQHARDAEE